MKTYLSSQIRFEFSALWMHFSLDTHSLDFFTYLLIVIT
jgi:hypothetical protein